MPTLSKSFVWHLLAGLDGEVLTGRGRLTGLRFSFCPRLLWIFKGFSLFVGFSFCSKIRDMITLCAPEKLWRDIQEIFRRDVQLSGATLVDLPLCYLCLHLNLEQRRQTNNWEESRTQGWSSRGSSRTRPHCMAVNYFTTSAFLPTAKLISNTKDKVCFAPFNTHFPVG